MKAIAAPDSRSDKKLAALLTHAAKIVFGNCECVRLPLQTAAKASASAQKGPAYD